MSNYTDYFAWLEHGRWIRVSARAIIFSPGRDQILVEHNTGLQNPYFNFIGGGLELEETLQECLARELREETDARMTAAKYLFVVENFIPYGTEIRHSLEHYFEITLDRENVTAKNDGVAFVWIPIAGLATADLRPAVVCETIRNGTYAQAGPFVLQDDRR